MDPFTNLYSSLELIPGNLRTAEKEQVAERWHVSCHVTKCLELYIN